MISALLLVACTPTADLPQAIVAPDRSGHWLDRPFPAEELILADGTLDLSSFPDAPSSIAAALTRGWAGQASEATHAFSGQAAVYLRFDGPLELADSYLGLPTDPVQLVSLDSGDRVPIDLRVFAQTDDPFLADGVLAIAPAVGAALRSGERYAAIVDDSVARPADGWTPPAGVPETAAAATVFPVQDSTGELRALAAAADAFLDADPDLLVPDGLRLVTHLSYAQGFTPSGNAATVATVTFEDGATELTYLGPDEDVPPIDVDLTTWPMAVYQATIHTVAFQGLADQPYASPGLGLLTDFDRRHDGWIAFNADGALLSTPEPEPMRIVIQVPRTGAEHAVMTWDHGTGGHAYSAVQRMKGDDDGLAVATRLADAGVVVVGRDQPLYGLRYPLIDEGFGSSLGFYNIVNLPAFRDNQRQAAVDHGVLRRFVRDVLPDLLPEGAVDPDRLGTFGHSLGSVTAHLGQAAAGDDGALAALQSGTGGYFTYYVLQTGLLAGDNEVVTTIGGLVGEELPADATPGEVLAAVLGLPQSEWAELDRFHPVIGLFQLIMDPSDALSVARDQARPETVILGYGDLQVPEASTRALLYGTPDPTLVECWPEGDYDGHLCAFRETVGLDAFADFGAWLHTAP